MNNFWRVKNTWEYLSVAALGKQTYKNEMRTKTVFGFRFQNFSFAEKNTSVDWQFRKPDENARQELISVQCAVSRD